MMGRGGGERERNTEELSLSFTVRLADHRRNHCLSMDRGGPMKTKSNNYRNAACD